MSLKLILQGDGARGRKWIPWAKKRLEFLKSLPGAHVVNNVMRPAQDVLVHVTSVSGNDSIRIVGMATETKLPLIINELAITLGLHAPSLTIGIHQYRTKSQSNTGLSWPDTWDAFLAKPWSDWVLTDLSPGQAYFYGDGYGYNAKEVIRTHTVLPSFPQTVNAYFNQTGGIDPYAHRGHAKVEMVGDASRFNTWNAIGAPIPDRPAYPGEPAFSVYNWDDSTVQSYMYEVDYVYFVPFGISINAARQTGWYGNTYITN